MAQTNVSSCVLSIVASFTSGLDVFKKFRETKSKKKKRNKGDASVDDEETRLARSLRQGPEDIGREYQKSIVSVGEGFAFGDVAAQTSLAEILLKLNTGLVTIINTFLTRDKRDVQLDYQSLTSLSERSRIDTCRTLRQLYRRMMQFRLPLQISPRDDGQQEHGESKIPSGRRARQSASQRYTKVRGPMLARVVIADSSKPSQVALVRPGERRKKSSSGSSTPASKTQSKASLSLPAPAPAPSKRIPELPARPSNTRSQTMPAPPPKPLRKQSAADINNLKTTSSQVSMRASRSTPRLPTSIVEHEPLPPVPNTAPLPAFEPRRRKPTPTYYSIESASTKLGEIPMHKWAEPYDFDLAARLNKEAERNGWPITSIENAQLRKRRGLLGLFRKKDA